VTPPAAATVTKLLKVGVVIGIAEACGKAANADARTIGRLPALACVDVGT
jgi:hypothetical protein